MMTFCASINQHKSWVLAIMLTEYCHEFLARLLLNRDHHTRDVGGSQSRSHTSHDDWCAEQIKKLFRYLRAKPRATSAGWDDYANAVRGAHRTLNEAIVMMASMIATI
jgi:hypothetical protein